MDTTRAAHEIIQNAVAGSLVLNFRPPQTLATPIQVAAGKTTEETELTAQIAEPAPVTSAAE